MPSTSDGSAPESTAPSGSNSCPDSSIVPTHGFSSMGSRSLCLDKPMLPRGTYHGHMLQTQANLTPQNMKVIIWGR